MIFRSDLAKVIGRGSRGLEIHVIISIEKHDFGENVNLEIFDFQEKKISGLRSVSDRKNAKFYIEVVSLKKFQNPKKNVD